MRMTEWKPEDALAFERKEGRGEIAENAPAEALPMETIQKINGRDSKIIGSLKNRVNR
jgi:hypothetical protein